jgi:hypothetical protein
VRHCPVGLAPAEGIAGLKRLSLARLFGLDGLGAPPSSGPSPTRGEGGARDAA